MGIGESRSIDMADKFVVGVGGILSDSFPKMLKGGGLWG